MEVILKEDVTKLGHRGDVVKVADGYGRNFLLPKKLAMEATPANKVVIEQMKASGGAAVCEGEDRGGVAGGSAQQGCAGLRAQGGRERPPCSARSRRLEIAQQLEAKGFTIDRRKVQLEEPLKSDRASSTCRSSCIAK